MKIAVFGFSVLALLLTGCYSLPDGTPPDGIIVSNPQTSDDARPSYAAARNRVADALTFALLAENRSARVRVNAPPAMRSLLRDALDSVRDVCPARYDAGGGYALSGEIDGKVWHYKLMRLHDGAMLCSGEFEEPGGLNLP